MYNAVGIDVSKSKSTVAVLQPGGTVIRKPFDVSHTSQNLNELADYLSSLDGTTKIVMECTGRYHEPMVKAFVSTVLTGVRYTCGWSLLRYLQSFPGSKNGSKVLLSTAVGVSLETSRTSFCGILPNKQYDN